MTELTWQKDKQNFKVLKYYTISTKKSTIRKADIIGTIWREKTFQNNHHKRDLVSDYYFLQNPGYYLGRDPKREGGDTFWRLLNVIIAREAHDEFSFLISRQPLIASRIAASIY